MQIGILGTGIVGNTLGTKLVEIGHDVKMGSRSADNKKAKDWVNSTKSPKASQGTFADAASFGEIVLNCTSGGVAIEALKMAGAQNLNGKVLIDVSNGLDFSKGMPPTLLTSNTDSIGEQVQRAFPEAKVVKSLNTIGVELMVNPQRLANGDHDIFVCGNDEGAKEQVKKILRDFGWKNIIDLGDITNSRGTEMYFILWIRLMMTQGRILNLHFQRQG
jgi:predicted dinucleotide-binding enzyme